MSVLDHITVQGFKSIASVERLQIRPINVLIGANGSGKSNFIGVFSFLQSICAGDLQDYVTRAGGAERILHFGSKATPRLSVQLSFNNGTNSYHLVLGSTSADELYPKFEEVGYWDKSFPNPLKETLGRRGLEAGISDPQPVRIKGWVKDYLQSWRIYHFHDTSAGSPMKKTGDVNDNRFLRPDGSNLAAFLYYLSQREPEHYSLIRRTIQQVAPFFDDFVLQPLELNPDTIRLQWKHRGTDAYFDASSFSDGTLRFIALSTLLLQPKRPSVVLLDEPELGLHPHGISILAALVKQASVTTQVILSTQSSLLLDHFEPEDVLVAERVDEQTRLVRLDSERLESWLEDYSLGQLWEKNELGGRPNA